MRSRRGNEDSGFERICRPTLPTFALRHAGPNRFARAVWLAGRDGRVTDVAISALNSNTVTRHALGSAGAMVRKIHYQCAAWSR